MTRMDAKAQRRKEDAEQDHHRGTEAQRGKQGRSYEGSRAVSGPRRYSPAASFRICFSSA
jgi:hypothetical protein